MSELSERMGQAILKSGKSQRQIAREIGITETSMSRYVRGNRSPKATVISEFAKAAGISAEWLLRGDRDMHSHVEMIIDYTTDGTDFQYCDNHGILIRCKDCKYYTAMVPKAKIGICSLLSSHFGDNGFCSDAEQRIVDEMKG